MKSHLYRSLVTAVLSTAFLGMAHAQVQEPSDAEMHLKAVRIKLEMTKVTEVGLTAKTVALVSLQAKQEAAKPALDRRVDAHNVAVAAVEASFDKHNAAAAALNAHRPKNPTASDVKQFNQRVDDLTAWGNRLESQKAIVNAQGAKVTAEVNAAEAAWNGRLAEQVQNQKDIEALNRKKAELIQDFNRTIDAILKFKNAQVDCTKIPGIGNLDLTTLDGASERARACLGKGFDTP